tara:strand:+ start:456 stop:713 length:258 start_codon:yes stop_codon:yes gene_type:complete
MVVLLFVSIIKESKIVSYVKVVIFVFILKINIIVIIVEVLRYVKILGVNQKKELMDTVGDAVYFNSQTRNYQKTTKQKKTPLFQK